MLSKINIKGFKSIENESLDFKPLTIITGLNSTGKSSVIQSILLAAHRFNQHNQWSMKALMAHVSNFTEIKNRYVNAKAIELAVHLDGNDKPIMASIDIDNRWSVDNQRQALFYEPDTAIDESELFYLSANRMGPEPVAARSQQKVGADGQYLFGSFEANKRESVAPERCHFDQSRLFSAQVSGWISQIVGIKTELKTEIINATAVKVSFDSDQLTDINPLNLGAGMSFVAKIIICCLLAKKDDLVIIENPEIHLHPKAQAQLGVFFAFMANAGVQIVLETHCEHLINKVCYQVYDEKLNHQDVVIHYKGDIHKPFELVEIDDDGQYLNRDKQVITFPSGFFDASLNDLLEMR